MIRKAVIVATIVAATIVTCLRAARLPNQFAVEHWLIDYRFGFVKRGLVGSVLSLAAGALGTRPTMTAIDLVAMAAFAGFCVTLIAVAVRMLRRSEWSSDVALAAVVFLSSPFMVMSAHLVGYYDNIVVMLAIASLALVFSGRIAAAAVVQSLSLLVHENTLLIAFPVVVWAGIAATRDARLSLRRLLPLLAPVAVFAGLAVRLGTAPHHLEQSLTHYLATYPFIADRLAEVRVPHWITIGFYESYVLHAGHLQERLLSQAMIALVLPSAIALIGGLFSGERLGAVSAESATALAICLLPQSMHVMVWDTARTWTYSILCAFLLLWVDVERRPRRTSSQVVAFVSLVALLTNVIGATPLMDGLTEYFGVGTRLWVYAPIVAVCLVLARQPLPSGAGEPGTSVVT